MEKGGRRIGDVFWGGRRRQGGTAVCEAATIDSEAFGVPVWVFLLTSWVALGKLLNISEPPL